MVIVICMKTRTVHLKRFTDKTSDAVLLVLHRFAYLRGHPSVCCSDCGTNVVGAQGYLREIMQSLNVPRVQNVLSRRFLLITNGSGIHLTQDTKTEASRYLSSLSEGI